MSVFATPGTVACQAPLSMGFSRQGHWSGLPFPSPMYESEKWNWSHSVMFDPQRPHGLEPTRLLHPWDFPGKSTGVHCHCLLQLVSSRGEISWNLNGLYIMTVYSCTKIITGRLNQAPGLISLARAGIHNYPGYVDCYFLFTLTVYICINWSA